MLRTVILNVFKDTVLGLEALTSFASLLVSSSDEDSIIVSVTSDADGIKHDFDPITQQNALVLQSLQVKNNYLMIFFQSIKNT